jgi:hypothetical protein
VTPDPHEKGAEARLATSATRAPSTSIAGSAHNTYRSPSAFNYPAGFGEPPAVANNHRGPGCVTVGVDSYPRAVDAGVRPLRWEQAAAAS